jgi:hypothetical protein
MYNAKDIKPPDPTVVPIRKGCSNANGCFCTGACQEVIGYYKKPMYLIGLDKYMVERKDTDGTVTLRNLDTHNKSVIVLPEDELEGLYKRIQ